MAAGKGAKPGQAGTGALKAPPGRTGNELLEIANRVMQSKDFQTNVPAPPPFDPATGVDLKISQKDQRDNGILGRRAYDIGGQLYIQDTVILSNGNTQEQWRLGNKPIT
jgi:hypothetical protein